LVVTTETISGFRIIGVTGEVIGIAARTQNPYAAGFVSPKDGSGCGDDARRTLLEACRWEAVGQMVDDAARAGANAVVAMRFDHRPVTANWIEVCAYGTAVNIVPVETPTIPQQGPLVGAGYYRSSGR
jgi:uncharacterized protein YbjQ (UPF0145 family)